jgi:hypothetical protein
VIAVLDPAWFVARDPGPENERALADDLGAVLALLRRSGARLVAAEDYWPPLWKELVQPLERRFPSVRVQLGELRKLGVPRTLPTLDRSHRVWGFEPMFGHPCLGGEWADRMAKAVLRLALGHAEEPLLLVAREVGGRNVVEHKAGHSVILESTRWRLYVQPGTAQPVAVPAVRSIRQIEVPWTARYDWRLPGAEDGARYPFCPPLKWWKRDVRAVGTHTSKPCFLDGRGDGWARPNIPKGAGYHWDVFLSSPELHDRIGVDQINVVAFGGPASEGKAGDLHHVPQDKVGAVRDLGWTCS